jgi:hypothetical protein
VIYLAKLGSRPDKSLLRKVLSIRGAHRGDMRNGTIQMIAGYKFGLMEKLFVQVQGDNRKAVALLIA